MYRESVMYNVREREMGYAIAYMLYLPIGRYIGKGTGRVNGRRGRKRDVQCTVYIV